MVTTKELTDSEKLLVKFNQWADELIADFESFAFLTHGHKMFLKGKIDALLFAKGNLKRLYQEIQDEHNSPES